MHTFFINTSKKDFTEYEVLFDLHFENKDLVSLGCPMEKWNSGEEGFLCCIKQMEEMIDGYTELNNAFNLIIYVDLAEIEAYSSIKRDAFHDKERETCCRAMHILFTDLIRDSIVEELVNRGRAPQNLLVMFGEEKKFAEETSFGKSAVAKKLFSFLGLPENETAENIAKSLERGEAEDKVAAFSREILGICTKEIIPGIRDKYKEDFYLWCDEIINEADIEAAGEALFNRINGSHRFKSERMGVETVSCPYDCYASRLNKSILAQSRLNIALYVLKCVEANSIYEKDGKTVREFHRYGVEEIAPVLAAKERIFAQKAKEIDELAKSYPELKLAPKLQAFDNQKFGLDEYGHKALGLTVNDAKPEEKQKEQDQKDEDAAVIKAEGKEVALEEKDLRRLFSKEELPDFDYTFEENSLTMVKKNATPHQYIEQAKKLRMHHLDCLKKLKVHVSDSLSYYAGKSKENKPALLKMGGYRYTKPGDERKSLESVEAVAQRAYESVTDRYMEFCAGRSVAVTDIEEECSRFVSKINQIRESLNKIKYVAVGLFIGIILLYIPYLIIQFESIIKTPLNILAAAACVAVPAVILYAVFAALCAAQRKKYIKAWSEFKERSDAVIAKNAEAARDYDRLLSSVIPALRWVYEYKLDVEYVAECCDIADAKIEHHRRKLRERAFAVKNILGDLEYEAPYEYSAEKGDLAEGPDYTLPFCTGKKNRDFYTVADKKALGLKES